MRVTLTKSYRFEVYNSIIHICIFLYIHHPKSYVIVEKICMRQKVFTHLSCSNNTILSMKRHTIKDKFNVNKDMTHYD